jgi:hypothetical protein
MFMKNMTHKSSVSTRRRLVKSCGSRKPLPLSSTIVKRVSAANVTEGSTLMSRALTCSLFRSSSANKDSDSGSQTIRTGQRTSGHRFFRLCRR